MKQPYFTIVIPTYNRADRNLRKVIDRALGQTYKNVEVIVSDNCSSYHTSELVGGITDPRLRYFRQESNIGPINNFNYCLSQAKGKYFLLFHDDDMIDEDFVEACYSMMKKLEELGIEPESAELQRIPHETKTLDKDSALKILKVVELFEDDDDVQQVFHNMEITDEVMAEM